jgi:hypothetical protein
MIFTSGSRRAIPWLIACTLAMPLYSAAQSIVATPAGLELGAGTGRESYTQEELDRFDPYRRELDDRSMGLERRYGPDGRELRREANIERNRAFDSVDPYAGRAELLDRGMEHGSGAHESWNVGDREHRGGYVGGERMGAGHVGGEHMGAGYSGGEHMGGGHVGGGGHR